jgi:ribulose-5-phosphate 4-epimerase/fuculose-1-phosphate aldolase
MIVDYRNALAAEDVLVAVRAPGAHAARLMAAVAGAGRSFGFTVTDFEGAARSAALVKHLLWRSDGPLTEARCAEAAALVGAFRSVSVAFDYASESEMLAAASTVDRWKASTRDRVNFLRPDVWEGGRLGVSDTKFVDNAVCDTVRVKYRPLRRSADFDVTTALPEAWRMFERASKVYGEDHLYLRSASDGYFARRHPDGGFVITATKTDKVHLDPARVSWVHGFDRASRTVTFSGTYLPSSDSVEAAVLFAERPEVVSVIHSHASDRFTRNPAYRTRQLVPQLPYGEAELGDAIVGALRLVDDGFVIMVEHGEIFSASSDEALFATLARHGVRSAAEG